MAAAAPIDHLVHHATMITLKGKSYRLRERGQGTFRRPHPAEGEGSRDVLFGDPFVVDVTRARLGRTPATAENLGGTAASIRSRITSASARSTTQEAAHSPAILAPGRVGRHHPKGGSVLPRMGDACARALTDDTSGSRDDGNPPDSPEGERVEIWEPA